MDGTIGELGNAVKAELFHNVQALDFDGLYVDTQREGDRFPRWDPALASEGDRDDGAPVFPPAVVLFGVQMN